MKVPEDIKDYLMEAHGLAGQWSLPDNRGSSESSQPIPLESVGIVGGGTMGRGMAISFCLGGFTTYLVLRSETVCI
uniref:3-hydroxyacyl-CoA dehydrogenase NAD binding domain-containing protein n=1 Tax=Caenorhabditis japonica TaxID=281687 RepID=A0A8R1I442_CAEJA